MKKVKFYNLFLVIRLVGLSVCLGFLCVSLFSARVFAQGTPSTTDKLDSPPSAASTDAKTKAPKKTKKTTIDFEDQLIEGSRQKPELFYLLQNNI